MIVWKEGAPMPVNSFADYPVSWRPEIPAVPVTEEMVAAMNGARPSTPWRTSASTERKNRI